MLQSARDASAWWLRSFADLLRDVGAATPGQSGAAARRQLARFGENQFGERRELADDGAMRVMIVKSAPEDIVRISTHYEGRRGWRRRICSAGSTPRRSAGCFGRIGHCGGSSAAR